MLSVRVGIIKSAVGLRGDVRILPTTDIPEQRFAIGQEFVTKNETYPHLTVNRMRQQLSQRGISWVVQFAQVQDRTQAEALRDVDLLIQVESAEQDNEFYYAELLELTVKVDNGEVIGQVSNVIGRTAQDLLEVKLLSGKTVLIPFVKQIVPHIDLGQGIITITPPPGLLDLS